MDDQRAEREPCDQPDALQARLRGEAARACAPSGHHVYPAWLQPGARVWYQSSPHSRHAGVVIGEPRPFRDGWTVPVGELDPPVPGKGGPDDGRVSRAAWSGALSPRVVDAEWAHLARALLRELMWSTLEHCPDVTDPPAIWHAAASMAGMADQCAWWEASVAKPTIRAIAEVEGITLPEDP